MDTQRWSWGHVSSARDARVDRDAGLWSAIRAFWAAGAALRPMTICHTILAFYLLFAKPAAAQDTTALRVDRPINRELAQHERQAFDLTVRANQFVVGFADQIDVDLVVTVYGPDGKQQNEFDGPARGAELFSFTAKEAGRYVIVVQPFRDNGPGRYTMHLLRVEPVARTREGRVDQLFAVWDRPGSPGASVAIERNGQILYEHGYGEAQVEYHIPIRANTIFHVASVSKQFTAFSIAMLASEGRLSLDDDVRKYIPELPDLGATVTLRHLLHHVSGWRDQWNLLALAGWRLDDVITKDQILRLLVRQRELNFQPGAEHLYSNTGFTLLAEVVARVTGESFPDWTREHLFQPLGMTRTHFHADHQEIVPDRAYSYENGPHGLQKSVLSYANVGATSLFTTAEDLARWMHNLQTGTVGGPDVLAMMHERYVLNGGDTIPYALGLVHGTFRGLHTVGHSGGDAGFRSEAIRFPDQNLSVTVLSNLGSVNPGQLANQVAEIYLEREMTAAEAAAPPAATAAAGTVSRELLDAYAGEYDLIGTPLRITFTRDGDRLVAQATGQSQFPLTPESDSVFVFSQATIRIVFRREPSGEVNRFTLAQGGSTLPGQRVGTSAPVAPVDLTPYLGAYDSPELETTYTLVARNDTLVAEHIRHDPITLTHVGPDRFTGSAWFFGPTVFERDSAGTVTGMRVSSGRVRNVLFVKRTGPVGR
jgi:CubicO group peptidase (beta-lactamase class C family)